MRLRAIPGDVPCFPVVSLGMGGRGRWNEEMTRFFLCPTANGSLRSHANQVPTKLARQGFAAASPRGGGACGPSRPLVALAVPEKCPLMPWKTGFPVH